VRFIGKGNDGIYIIRNHPAGMAELADAADSKSADRKVMGVRFPLPAPIESMVYQINASSDAFFCAQTVPKLKAMPQPKPIRERLELSAMFYSM
jgi:hypothetical protein